MIGLLFRMYEMPFQIAGCVAAIVMLCGCYYCVRIRCRDFSCIKWALRTSGHDSFDDFELMVLVHEVLFDRKEEKLATLVKITAGMHSVQSDTNSKGIFQQPLHVTVEQGTTQLTVDLLDSRQRVLSQLTLDIFKDILGPKTLPPEQIYAMKQKNRGILNPRVKLSIIVSQDDAEAGLAEGASTDTDWLVRQQLIKAREGLIGGKVSEMDVLKSACAGPLDLFEGLGSTGSVYVAILGPPVSRRWVLGVWKDQREFEQRHRAVKEVDMLKVQSVQADPTRTNVFVINYFDEHRVGQRLTFRRIDRARDVWVEMLQLVITKAHASRKAMKQDNSSRSLGGKSESSRSMGGSHTSADFSRRKGK